MNEPVFGQPKPAGRIPDPRLILRSIASWCFRVVAGLFALALLIHTIWLICATISSNRAIEFLKAAGEPTTPATLQPPIPAGHNAFEDLKEAGEKLRRASAAKERLEQVNSPIAWPLHRIESERIGRYLDEYFDVEPLVSHASAAPVNVTTTVLASPLLLMQYPGLNDLRDVAYYQKYRALQALEAGQSDQALSRLTEIEPIAVAGASNSSLVSWLMGTGCRAIQADVIMQMAPDLRIGTERGAASPDQVRRLIASLLDDRVILSELHTAFRGERVMVIDSLRAMDSGNSLDPKRTPNPAAAMFQRYVMRPSVRSSITACVRYSGAVIAALPAPNMPAARAQLDKIPKPSMANFFARLLMPSYDRAFQSRYMILTDRWLAAIALACRWYALDHGRPVEKWSDLVPAYLPAVPDDLFTDGQPIQARFNGENTLFWSVGQNGRDDQADEMTKWGVMHDWAAPDRVLHLTRLPREFGESAQRQFDLDPDALIAQNPPTTLPTTQLVASIPTAGPLIFDEIVRLDVWGGPDTVAGLRTRRDVIAALIRSVEEPEPEASTRPADQSAAAVEGIATFEASAVRFRFTADGTLTLGGEDGATMALRWEPYVWKPETFSNQWWR